MNRYSKYDDDWYNALSMSARERLDPDVGLLISRRRHLGRGRDPFWSPGQSENFAPPGVLSDQNRVASIAPTAVRQSSAVPVMPTNQVEQDTGQYGKYDIGADGNPVWQPPVAQASNFADAPGYEARENYYDMKSQIDEKALQESITSKKVKSANELSKPTSTTRREISVPGYRSIVDDPYNKIPQIETPGFGERIQSLAGGATSAVGDFFNDPRRVALVQAGLTAMDPNSYYDPEGFHSTWGGLNKALGAGVKTYKELSKPKELSFKEQEEIKQQHRMALEQSKYRKPLNLDSKDSYMFSRAKTVNPNVTPEDIASNKFSIPLEWHQDYAKINAQTKGYTYEQQYTISEAGKDIDLRDVINESADSARTMDAELDSQFSILHSEKAGDLFGPYADWKMNMLKVWDVTGFPDNSSDITTYEIFQKSTMEMLLEQLRKQKGPQTEGDATRALKTLPDISNTVLGSKYIVAMKKAINARAVAKQQFMDQYMLDPERGDGYPKGLGRAWARSDIGNKSIFQWIADLGGGYSSVLVELYETGVLTGPEMKKIVLGME